MLITESLGILPIHSGNFCRLGFSGNDKNCSFCKLQIDSGIEATQPTKWIAVNSLKLPIDAGIFKSNFDPDLAINSSLWIVYGNVSKNSSNP